MKVLFRGVAHPDQFDFGALLGHGPKFPAQARPWLMSDGRCVMDRRPLPSFKRTFVHLMVLHMFGSDLRRWM
jgi:hypothetical protein